ncbi:ankyrin repeat domain-containing protein [Candidatus Dependentiae bacterium]|nr:ankyrin repeat domain-containing protein [Candidatus Dependentiae bacterium]
MKSGKHALTLSAIFSVFVFLLSMGMSLHAMNKHSKSYNDLLPKLKRSPKSYNLQQLFNENLEEEGFPRLISPWHQKIKLRSNSAPSTLQSLPGTLEKREQQFYLLLNAVLFNQKQSTLKLLRKQNITATAETVFLECLSNYPEIRDVHGNAFHLLIEYLTIFENNNEKNLLAKSARLGYYDPIKRFLDQGLHPNTLLEKNNTLLHIAAKHGRYNLIKLLLKYHANPFIENDSNKIPLTLVIEKQQKLIGKKKWGQYYKVEQILLKLSTTEALPPIQIRFCPPFEHKRKNSPLSRDWIELAK